MMQAVVEAELRQRPSHESTFAGATFSPSSRKIFTWLEPYRSAEPEFAECGTNIFESEDLVVALYDIFLTLIADAVVGPSRADARGIKIDDAGMPYLHGFYLPCVKRISLLGQVDMKNDRLLDYAGLVNYAIDGGDIGFVSMRKIGLLPMGWAQIHRGTNYAFTMLYKRDEKTFKGAKQPIGMMVRYLTVADDGRMLPAHRLNSAPSVATVNRAVAATAAITLNLNNDARGLWNVRVAESVMGSWKTPLRLGTSAEHVKSLFYARQAPLTESGRKRPILHWVRAHQRRIKEGIDIDVMKHLRGIEQFEMDGMEFEITQPVKAKRTDHSPEA